MNFRQLRYILTINEERSISKAAQKLYISQSALSQQLLKVETELGEPIFDRTLTPLALTYLGAQYIDYVQRILFEYDEAMSLFERSKQGDFGRIVVGIPKNRSVQVLPTFLPQFTHAYPNIQIVLEEAPSFRLDEMIMSGEIDCSVMVSRAPNEAIEFLPLIQEEVYLAISNKDAQCLGVTLDFSRMGSVPFILMKKWHRLRSISDTLFQQANFTPKLLFETDSPELALQTVAMGTGACLTTALAKNTNKYETPPIYYSLGDKGVFWTLGISHHKNKFISHPMELFFRALQEYVTLLDKES